jgi:hypothetical protein
VSLTGDRAISEKREASLVHGNTMGGICRARMRVLIWPVGAPVGA